MSLIIPEDLPSCINKPIEEAVTPLAKSIGKTINDLWFLAFGGISQAAEMKRIKYYCDGDEKLKKSTGKKIEAIPPENRIEPNIQIACQALEDSKYCVENEDIREMFANLIASTMDKSKCSSVHPSYSAILKQMTSEEALFLKKFLINNEVLPICRYWLESSDYSYATLIDSTYFTQKAAKRDEIDANALIISSLERLGLIQVHFDSYLNDSRLYEVYENSNIIGELIKSNLNENSKVAVKKGYANLTVLGKNFLSLCCPHTTLKIPTSSPNHDLNLNIWVSIKSEKRTKD